ncbi:MAG: four-carbon acid sugar kinase family protein [Chitinophagaceae bacterium]
MIAVIADDLTGAAELAGIGLRYGLEVELWTALPSASRADLVVVSTDSRSVSKDEAVKITGRVLECIKNLQPEWIYKKIDSVFRGHVLEELKLQMQLTGPDKAIVLAANPSLGRTIRDGVYYVNGVAVSETGFAADPEFAISNSSVRQMLQAGEKELEICRHTGIIPDKGIIVAEAATNEEVAAWADKAGNHSVLAGAGDFFAALLDKTLASRPQPQPDLERPFLYVCGTAFAGSHAFIKEVQRKHGCVAYLPVPVLQGQADEVLVRTVHELLRQQGRAIVAIDPDETRLSDFPAPSLRKAMANTVKMIIQAAPVRELFVEGGSTASAVLAALDIQAVRPVNELQRGVVRMKDSNDTIYITVKPGSYALPKLISALYY